MQSADAGQTLGILLLTQTACDGNPTDFNKPCNALRINSSSSTIATSFAFVE